MKNCFHNICIHESHDKKAMCVMSHYQFTYYNNVCQITTFILVCVLFYIIIIIIIIIIVAYKNSLWDKIWYIYNTMCGNNYDPQ